MSNKIKVAKANRVLYNLAQALGNEVLLGKEVIAPGSLFSKESGKWWKLSVKLDKHEVSDKRVWLPGPSAVTFPKVVAKVTKVFNMNCGKCLIIKLSVPGHTPYEAVIAKCEDDPYQYLCTSELKLFDYYV